MKPITYYLKTLVIFVATSFSFFACQDEFGNELANNHPVGENPQQYQIDNVARSNAKTFVLVHGAWHPKSCWDDVKWLLEKAGHKAIAVQLTGLGDDPTPVETVTFQDHVEAVQDAIGQVSGPVILVGHSYAGAVISQVGELMPDKIQSLVYVSGFMPANGESVVQHALSDTQSLVTQNLILDGAVAYLTPENYGSALYNEALASPIPYIVGRAEEIIPQLRPHPIATLVTPLQLTGSYENLRKVYVSCLKDKAVTPASQYAMYNRFNGVVVYTLAEADHSPFISTPVSLFNILRKQ